MANETKPVATQVDPWKTSKETWQYVTIPDEDVTGKTYPSIWLHKTEFKPAKTYHVPPQVAEYVNGRVKAYNRSVTRLFSPMVDRVALNDVSVGTTSPAAPSGYRPGYVDATAIQTQ
jgi:hypothetical protein